MSDVTVIGLGEMGSALAGALLRAGKDVTVWNRSAGKAAPLQRTGATLAATVHEAVQASPVSVVCVSDYPATTSLLANEGVAATLRGRLVVQLTSGTPRQARELDAWATSMGAVYLDGAIAAWPRQIGQDDAVILVSGPDTAFGGAQPLLKTLAGGVSYVGPQIGNAMGLFNAALAYLAGHWIGFSHGAAICEAEGLSTDAFGDMMATLAPVLGEDLRHMGRAIAENRFENPESTLRTAGADIGRLVELSGDLNIGSAFPNFAAAVFQRAVDAGFGAEEHCAIVKVLRTD